AETVAMGTTVYAGLAVTSHNNSATVTATFDHVQIIPAVELTSHLDVSASANLVNPGTPVTVTVKALDAFNNVVTDYRGTVHLASSDPAAVFVDAATGQALPGNDYTFTAADNGVHAFRVTLPDVGSQTLTVTDVDSSNTVRGATVVTVTNNPLASNFLVTGFP